MEDYLLEAFFFSKKSMDEALNYCQIEKQKILGL